MTDTFSTLVLGFSAISLSLAWTSWQAYRTDLNSPERLVVELRLSQYSALLLLLVVGVYVGLGISHENIAGTGFDVAIAVGFFVIVSSAITWEPAKTLTALSLAWIGHSFVDLAHIINLLPGDIAPAWYPRVCAIYDVCVAAICYLPLLRR